VTDANVLLGRIGAEAFLGGELVLDRDAAARVLAQTIGEPLGYAGDEALLRLADGIIAIATVTMAGAIRRVSVEHGRDPREFVLFAYGGGGPLHASALARELSIPTVIVPPEPGTFSATGMLLADARLDDATTFVARFEPAAIATMDAQFRAMETAAIAGLRAEFGDTPVRLERFAEMRYVGQRHNIKVPIPPGSDAAAIRRAFDDDYRRRYGHADAGVPAEFQALHLSAFARLDRPDIRRLPRPQRPPREPGRRTISFGSEYGLCEARVYDRYALAPGFRSAGPAVLEEYGSTTVVWPGDRFEIGELHEIRIDCGAAAEAAS
jgi:N-methylhydantoinase A